MNASHVLSAPNHNAEELGMSQAETTINGYELVTCIATGNTSQVWEVKQPGSGQTYAMKLLLPETLSDAEHKRTMRHEASVMKQFEHPNIVRFVESKVARKHAYIIMELFRSMNLKSLIRTDLDSVHVRLKKLMECATQAFAYMHEKNWLHRDIKPDNILLTKGGEMRVIDFSLASRPSSSVGRMMTRKKNIAIQGTRTYISPEQIRREKTTKASDIYSLGVLFFEALTGRPPFMGTNPNELLMAHVRDQADVPSSYHPNVSPEVDALVMRMLSKKPKDRPESMQQVFSEVRSLKFFKQDPEDYRRERLAAEAEERRLTVDQRLDSRKDAARTEEFGYQPMTATPNKQKPAPVAEPPAAPAAPQPAATPAASPAPMPPPMMPQQPMMPQPPMPMQPTMAPPMAAPYPGPPPTVGGVFPPGMPPGQMPGQVPGQPYPQQQQPAQAPLPQAQQPVAPAAPQPVPAPQPAQQPNAPAKDEKDLETPDNLDWLNVT